MNDRKADFQKLEISLSSNRKRVDETLKMQYNHNRNSNTF